MATAQVNATADKRSTIKLDTIRDIERQMQKVWNDLKIFEADAPGHVSNKYDSFH